MAKSNSDEVRKLEQHLSLLRQEYMKLQTKLAEAERRNQMMSAASGNTESLSKDCFVSKLVRTVSELFEKDMYSDLVIKLDGHQLRAHKFVLAAHSDQWGVVDLSSVEHLNLNDLSYSIGHTMLQWMYTDSLNLNLGDNILMELMVAAKRFGLSSLFERCEQALISRIDVSNCVRFYQHAEQVDADSLKDQSSQLITSRWDDFTSQDFAEIPASLLYKMLRNKTSYPLHFAIKLRRDDVVFLFLVEFDSQLSTKCNICNDDGDLPLGLALFDKQTSLAKSLLSHQTDVNAKQSDGRTLLIRALLEQDYDAARFLLDNGADPNSVDPQSDRSTLQLVAQTVPDESQSTSGMLPIVQLLLSKKADIARRGADGNSAVHLALKSENKPVLMKLLPEVNEVVLNTPNADGFLPLWYALENSFAEFSVPAELIKYGANINAVNVDSGNSLLQLCILDVKSDAAEFLISENADVRNVNKKGENALHLACHEGISTVCNKLLESGCNPNAQTNRDVEPVGLQTPLHIAIDQMHEEIVKMIIDFRKSAKSNQIKPDFAIADASGETALGFALWSNYFEVAKTLIEGGVDVNSKNTEGRNLLHRAIQRQDKDAALFLLSYGSNTNEKTDDEQTPLLLAIESHMSDVVRELCKRGANLSTPNADGECPLWIALSCEQESIASILVEFGCDTDAWSLNSDGHYQETLLHRFIDSSNESAACFLVQSQCDFNAIRKPGPSGEGDENAYDKQTPLHLATQWALAELVNCLIEHGANINSQDIEGRTAVHNAVINHSNEILSALLKAPGVNLSLRDRKGTTPFSASLTQKNTQAANLILEKDPMAAYQVDGKGYNYLHNAIKNQDLEAVLFLLSIHMDVNVPVRDSPMFTPLHLAVQVGDEMIVRNLLLAGANVHTITTNKKTALHVACAHDKSVIAGILIENHVNVNELDDNLNTALHVAVSTASLACVRVLLTEANIDADFVNIRGQTALHLLGTTGKENAAAIFDLFLKNIPNCPVDKPDAEGNSLLMLAYMNGNVQLCKACVRSNCVIGHTNIHGISIFNFEVATKQLLYKLLEQISKEPKWSEGEHCSECGLKFNLTNRRHHCRHCGRLLCSKDSENLMPILKYDLQKPVRVCNVCYEVLTKGSNPFD